MIAVTLTVVTTHVIIGTIDEVDTIVGTIVTGTADETAVVAADFGHVTLTDAVVTTIEEAVMITDDEITMTTIHVITIQDHVIMTEEIMIDDQMMKILRRKGIIIRVIPAKNDLLTLFDPRAQTFRVNVELSPYYDGRTRKWGFRVERLFSSIFFEKKIDHVIDNRDDVMRLFIIQ